MITDVIVKRSEGNISIHTATEADKEEYTVFELGEEFLKSLDKAGTPKGIDIRAMIWDEQYEKDCIMFVIVENSSGKTIGYCEINHVYTAEPTIGITLSKTYRGKGYGYIAAKLMVEEGRKIFDHPYFVWEVEQDNIASKKIALKLGGKSMNNRCAWSENMVRAMRENGIEIKQDDLPNSVERYKIERP